MSRVIIGLERERHHLTTSDCVLGLRSFAVSPFSCEHIIYHTFLLPALLSNEIDLLREKFVSKSVFNRLVTPLTVVNYGLYG